MSAPVLSRKDALRELDLEGTPPGEDISRAFRRKAKALNGEVTAADMENALRRLIEARDRLIKETFSQPSTYDTTIPLRISLVEAIYGGRIVRDLPEPAMPYVEQTASGRTVLTEITIRPGLRPDEVAEIRCNGRAYRYRIQIESDDIQRAHGDDIWMQTEIDGDLLRFGGGADISTPHGPVHIHIQPGCLSGSCLIIPGKGLPKTDTRPAGKLYVRLIAKVAAPKAYSDLAAQFRNRWVAA